MSDLGIADSNFNPFLWAGSKLPSPKRPNYRDVQSNLEHAAKVHETATSMQIAHSPIPTPENTGAPVPGYRKRGAYITPSSTGAPMPGTLKNNTAVHPITQAKVPSVPVKRSNAKQSSQGMKSKKK